MDYFNLYRLFSFICTYNEPFMFSCFFLSGRSIKIKRSRILKYLSWHQTCTHIQKSLTVVHIPYLIETFYTKDVITSEHKTVLFGDPNGTFKIETGG